MLSQQVNPLEQCQLKFVNETKGEFEGYVSVFNSNDAVNDTVLKGAFLKSLAERMPLMYVNHDHRDNAIPSGKWLEMAEDDHGLYGKGRIFVETEKGRHAYIAAKEGVLSGLSIGYGVKDFEAKSGGGRILKEVNLIEASLVAMPCDGKARITNVKFEEFTSLKDGEALLREAGFSKSMATAIASQFRRVARCENEAEYARQIAELKSHVGRLNAKLLITRIV